jgi:Cu(I)/Ag(I) efflux system membrane fusion protein
MNKYIKYSFVAVVILVVGFGVYYGMNNYNTQPAVEKATEVYTCSMHPEIIRDEPGNCPICGMNLVKVTEGQSVESHSIDHLLRPTDKFVGDFQTTTAKDTVSSEIKLPGIVATILIHQ